MKEDESGWHVAYIKASRNTFQNFVGNKYKISL